MAWTRRVSGRHGYSRRFPVHGNEARGRAGRQGEVEWQDELDPKSRPTCIGLTRVVERPVPQRRGEQDALVHIAVHPPLSNRGDVDREELVDRLRRDLEFGASVARGTRRREAVPRRAGFRPRLRHLVQGLRVSLVLDEKYAGVVHDRGAGRDLSIAETYD